MNRTSICVRACAALLTLPAAVSLVIACSSSSPTTSEDGGTDGGAGDACIAYTSTADLSTPVSFQNDVVPIFQSSCSLSTSCHGDPSTAPLQPYFGPKAGGVDAQAVLMPIVSMPSAEDPGMSVVAPSDPAHSYLQHKIDGDQCTLATGCAGGPFPTCGSSMPYQQPLLDVHSRDIVRAWIAQGAKSN